MAYFDNAATTYPKPEAVYAFMDAFYRASGGNAGRGQSAQAQTTGRLTHETRARLQKLFHAPAKQVIFAPTATIALNMILQGLARKGARTFYLSPFEHNAVTRTLYALKQSAGCETKMLTVRPDLVFDEAAIEAQFRAKKPDVLVLTHASNVFGLIAPAASLFRLAKRYGAVTVLDMSQTAGLVDFDGGLTTVDFLVFAGHKTLYGPTGIAGFLMKPEFVLPAVLFGGTGYASASQEMPEELPEHLECGTLNTVGIAGLYAALGWIEETGIGNIWAREQEHRQRLLALLARYPFVEVVGNVPGRDYVGIVSFRLAGISSDSAGGIFAERGIACRTGLDCAPLAHRFLGTFPAGTVRLSVSYFTSEADFAALAAALDDIGEAL